MKKIRNRIIFISIFFLFHGTYGYAESKEISKTVVFSIRPVSHTNNETYTYLSSYIAGIFESIFSANHTIKLIIEKSYSSGSDIKKTKQLLDQVWNKTYANFLIAVDYSVENQTLFLLFNIFSISNRNLLSSKKESMPLGLDMLGNIERIAMELIPNIDKAREPLFPFQDADPLSSLSEYSVFRKFNICHYLARQKKEDFDVKKSITLFSKKLSADKASINFSFDFIFLDANYFMINPLSLNKTEENNSSNNIMAGNQIYNSAVSNGDTRTDNNSGNEKTGDNNEQTGDNTDENNNDNKARALSTANSNTNNESSAWENVIKNIFMQFSVKFRYSIAFNQNFSLDFSYNCNRLISTIFKNDILFSNMFLTPNNNNFVQSPDSSGEPFIISCNFHL